MYPAPDWSSKVTPKSKTRTALYHSTGTPHWPCPPPSGQDTVAHRSNGESWVCTKVCDVIIAVCFQSMPSASSPMKTQKIRHGATAAVGGDQALCLGTHAAQAVDPGAACCTCSEAARQHGLPGRSSRMLSAVRPGSSERHETILWLHPSILHQSMSLPRSVTMEAFHCVTTTSASHECHMVGGRDKS